MDWLTDIDHPLITRYASKEMAALWSPRKRIGLWRRLWLALATCEAELGLKADDGVTPRISRAQLDALANHLDDIDFENAARHEKRLRHDVMAHVHAFGEVAPAARTKSYDLSMDLQAAIDADPAVARDAAAYEVDAEAGTLRFGDGVLSWGRDVTEERAFTRSLIETEKMVSVGTLAGGVAQDERVCPTVVLNRAAIAQAVQQCRPGPHRGPGGTRARVK